MRVDVPPPAPGGIPGPALRRALERQDPGRLSRWMEAGFRQLPAYTRFAWAVDRGAVVRWNVELIWRWMLGGTPPDDYIRSELHELLRARAIAGQPVEDSLLVYRRGARMFWSGLLDLAGEDDRAVLIAAADTVWGYLEDYLDLIVATFAEAYAEQAGVPSTAGDRRARTLFDRLCAALPVTVEDRDRAARLDFDLAAPYCPFTAQLAGGPPAAQADLAFRLRAAKALAFTEGVRVTGLTPPGFDWATYTDDPRLVLARDPPVARAGLAAAAERLRALVAIAAGEGRRGPVALEDFLPELLLASSPGLAERAAARVLGPLEAAGAPELVATVRSLVAHGFDSAATAAALPVHRNTLLHRVARIEKLTGMSLQDQRTRTLVLLAVTWEDIRRALGPAGD